MTATAPTITAEMTIPEIMEHFPQTVRIFERFGIKSQGYRAMAYENLFASARVHQISLEDILAALNEAVS